MEDPQVTFADFPWYLKLLIIPSIILGFILLGFIFRSFKP
jgi:hypothetical protein